MKSELSAKKIIRNVLQILLWVLAGLALALALWYEVQPKHGEHLF